MKEKAIVYCEKQFSKMDGKTANGLVMHSEKYDIPGVIDSTKAGMDAGKCLDGIENGIPIFRDIDDAIMGGQEWGSEFTLRFLWSLASLHSHSAIATFGAYNRRVYGSRPCRSSAQMLGFASHFAYPPTVKSIWMRPHKLMNAADTLI